MHSHTKHRHVLACLNKGLLSTFVITTLAFSSLTACTPSVQVALPNEPININLNVKIQHEILIKIDKQLDNMFSSSSGLF
ncbi:hypothetical protein JCM30760_10790 [Thiomicrorhabdus hydrogeniphila]